MRPIVLCIFLLLSGIQTRAQYVWQTLPTAPKSLRCDDVFFLNPSLGWAINPPYNFGTSPLLGRIFKTTDGGNTWQKQKDSSITFYRSIGFADSLTGWVGSLGLGFCADSNVLYETVDGGVSWHVANMPYPRPKGICGISVVTPNVVYAYGRYYEDAGYLKTTDKGASWQYKDMNAYARGLIDGWFFDADTGFISGVGHDHKSVILYTNDGGNTWQERYHSTRSDSEFVWKLHFPTRATGYAALQHRGKSKGVNMYFLKTTDGGASWVEYPFITGYSEQGVGFINDSTGWIGGDFYQPNYKTTDGGNTWIVDPSFGILTPPYDHYDTFHWTGFKINRFRSFGDTLMYAAGNTIYKLTNTVGVHDVANRYHIGGIYPNPFQKQTTVWYYLKEPADEVVVRVTDVAGRELICMRAGRQSRGRNEYVLHTELAPGNYYITVTDNKNFIMTKAIVRE